MFKEYNDDCLSIIYQDGLEDFVNNFVLYYKENINLLLKKFHLNDINKITIRLFFDKKFLDNVPYKIGDFAGFFNSKGANCYININGNKKEIDIFKAIIHEVVHHIYRFYIEDDVNNRITWFDEGLAMNYSFDHDKYNDDDNFIILLDKIFNIKNMPCINDLKPSDNFITDDYNGYDLAYLAVRYLLEVNTDEEFYYIMRDKSRIINIGKTILEVATKYYTDEYNFYLGDRRSKN